MATGLSSLPAKSNDLWVAGWNASADSYQIRHMIAAASEDVSVMDSGIAQTHKDVPDGDFTISAFYRSQGTAERIYKRWLEEPGEEPLPLLMAAGDGISVGEAVIAACVEPVSLSMGGSAKTAIRLDATLKLNGQLIFGILRSSQTSVGNRPLRTTAPTDLATLAVNTASGVVRTPVVATTSTASKPSALIGSINTMTGDDAEKPTITFDLTGSTTWKDGAVRGADVGKTLTIGHTVDGVLVEKTIGPWSLDVTTATVQEDIERLRWADGFHIFIVANQNPQAQDTEWILTGNQGGSDKDIEFSATNTIPTGAPFTGSDSGTDGAAAAQLNTSTGSGGSRVFVGRGDIVPADAHDLPAQMARIIPEGFSQSSIALNVPPRQVGAPLYDFSVGYTIATITDGDL